MSMNEANNLLVVILIMFITILAVIAYYVSGAPFSTWTVEEGIVALLIGYAIARLLWKDD